MPDNAPPLPTLLSTEEFNALRAQDANMLRRLDSKDYVTRNEAVKECQRLPISRILGLMQMLEAKPRRPSDAERRRIEYEITIAAVCSLIIVLFGASIGSAFLLNVVVVLFSSFICWRTNRNRPTRYSIRATSSLAVVVENIRDPDFLPFAMRVLYKQKMGTSASSYSPNSEIQKGLDHAAWVLLQTLDMETIRSMGLPQQAFYWFLSESRWRTHPSRSIRVLQILEAIGTPSAIPTVKYIASDLMTPQEAQPVKKAAQACLAILKERERESKLPQTLLRASGVPTPAVDTLLRPAVETSGGDPAHLLRPAVTQTDAAHVSGTWTRDVLQAQQTENVQNTRT